MNGLSKHAIRSWVLPLMIFSSMEEINWCKHNGYSNSKNIQHVSTVLSTTGVCLQMPRPLKTLHLHCIIVCLALLTMAVWSPGVWTECRYYLLPLKTHYVNIPLRNSGSCAPQVSDRPPQLCHFILINFQGQSTVKLPVHEATMRVFGCLTSTACHNVSINPLPCLACCEISVNQRTTDQRGIAGEWGWGYSTCCHANC